VRQHEVQRRVAVPAMPVGQPVEADEPLEPLESCEQDDLYEREVRAEEPRDPSDAREQIAGRVDLGGIAAMPPQPDDHDDVTQSDRPEGEGDGGTAARTPAPRRDDGGTFEREAGVRHAPSEPAATEKRFRRE
jgi:hypothetical protein